METFDKIVVQEGAVLRKEKQFDNDVEYVRKDIILQWAKIGIVCLKHQGLSPVAESSAEAVFNALIYKLENL